MDRELQGHPAAAMGCSGFSLAENFGMQGYESHELYSFQATSAADFHRSFEQQDTSNVSCLQQNFLFNDGKLLSAQTVTSGSQRLKLSKFLLPAQELLNEFCDLGGFMKSSKHTSRSRRVEEGGTASSASLPEQSFKALHILELQKRKANLLGILEELDRRYKRYCEQMATLASSFEAVAGEGAATVYLALASKAMSRHFRSLRDGIVGQMQATRKAIAERDPIAAKGISRGETPGLKLVEQYFFRQQKAFQHGSIFIDQQPWRLQRGLPVRSVSILRAWLFEHFLHPYPSDVDKHILARQTGLSRNQVTNWFINARVRLWKPMIEEIYSEEMKEDGQNLAHQAQQDNRNPNPSVSTDPEKPAELLAEPDSLTSIIHTGRQDHANQRSFHNYQNQEHKIEHFGLTDFDFSSYSECSGQSYSGNGVSLTLGLQQHNHGGGSGGGSGGFSFPSASHQQIAMIHDDVRKLSYRNFVGAQSLQNLGG